MEASMRTKLVIAPVPWLLSLLIVGCGSSASQPSSTKPASSKSATSAKASSGAAGKSAASTATTGGAGSKSSEGTAGGGTTPAANMQFPDPRGACNIDSGFPDDNACILPPSPEEGMQIHIGPTDYKDMAQVNKFIIHPGAETDSCWTFHTPNDKEIDYQTSVLSARSGSHHIINTMYKVEMTDGGFTMCADGGAGSNSNILATLPGASKPYMPRLPVAPENEHVGRVVPPNTPAQADMHNFNFTDKDTLREYWMNIYFVDKAQITDESKQIRGFGGLDWTRSPIAMGTDMVYQYSAPIQQDGRIIMLLGHYHSHGKRFTAYLQRGSADPEKVFEMYDYLDPAEFQYDSITTNPAFSASAAGAASGGLEVHAGDTLQWECRIVNDDQANGLRYTNQVKTGEMCNLWGQAVGPAVDCNCFGSQCTCK
jgi:hypothetical protein